MDTSVPLTEQEKEFELLLKSASQEPGYRPLFIEKLLNSFVFVLGVSDTETVDGVLQTGAKLSLNGWTKESGETYIPFFTSKQALSKSIRSVEPIIGLVCKTLFEITTGKTLILNPGHEISKEFTPYEVQKIIENGLGVTHDDIVVKSETKIQLGVPADHPGKLIRSVSLYLKNRPEVAKAYLCLMTKQENSNSLPELLIGVEFFSETDTSQLFKTIGAIGIDCLPPDRFVNIIRMKRAGDGDPFTDYFLTYGSPFFVQTASPSLPIQDASKYSGLVKKFLAVFKK